MPIHVTAPHPDGEGHDPGDAGRARRGAALPRAAVGYVNAHGTATPQNDRIEARRSARVFGEGGVLVSSTKSLIGHTMAAAGSLEAVATVLALEHELLPPTASLVDARSRGPLRLRARASLAAAVECAISNSFGFGGQNVTLLFRRA